MCCSMQICSQKSAKTLEEYLEGADREEMMGNNLLLIKNVICLICDKAFDIYPVKTVV